MSGVADERTPRRRPARVGDLLPGMARALGLERELRLAGGTRAWDGVVAELLPAAAGACRLVRIEDDALVVAAGEPIVAAELRLRATELLAAFAAAPGGVARPFLRLVRDDAAAGERRTPRV